MKVTAFIRKTSAKNNVTDLARVYFRVRDIGGVDIKAASELSISPNHWSAEKQGYKPRVALVSEEKRMNFDRDIQQITHLITKEYHRGVDGNWLKRLIEEYHHPDINARGGNKAEEYHLVYQISRYIAENTLADDSYKHHLGNIDKISVTSVSSMKYCTVEALSCVLTRLPPMICGSSRAGYRRNIILPDNIHCSIRMWKSRNTSKSAPRTALQAIFTG